MIAKALWRQVRLGAEAQAASELPCDVLAAVLMASEDCSLRAASLRVDAARAASASSLAMVCHSSESLLLVLAEACANLNEA